MKLLVIWRLLTVGGVNAGWRNRAIYFKEHGINTEFLYCKDLGGLHMMKDIAPVYVTKDENEIHHMLKHHHYDAVIVVDTNQAYKWLSQANYTGPILIEARTPEIIKLKRNLEGFETVNPIKFIVPSEHQKRVLSILVAHNSPTEVIYNGVDTSFFKQLPREQIDISAEPYLPNNKKVVAYIGRLDQRKNWKQLMKIAKLMYEERNDVEFWVIGGDQSKDRTKFENKWKNNELNKIIKWFPIIPYQQMPHLYAKIKQSGGCTIATTKGESFGNTFIEAMACGVPVVAPNVSSIPEIVIHEETGYLFREGDIEEAAKSIYKVLDNPVLYESLSNAAIQRVVEIFSISQCADKYVRMLQKFMKES
ncbi:glycosyltransferase family 4 protein [Chengkuizengella axinellae]|uniref:Glycosyltransferase family 4 protein n=1 Tax=Chengkuizengella axinellae TaxID=3064388 RepID=A0ABT9J4K8_9BACL|nr:glycosyltransferase family 4 protein [Chengkuizengella sp. 2205SS18-9]MDP5276418.1 glycosyltransferase family 4 protein [Chengkuizengella sp. 2205SS18-9]